MSFQIISVKRWSDRTWRVDDGSDAGKEVVVKTWKVDDEVARWLETQEEGGLVLVSVTQPDSTTMRFFSRK